MLLHKKEFFGNGFFTADHVTVCGLLVLFLCYFGLCIRTHVETCVLMSHQQIDKYKTVDYTPDGSYMKNVNRHATYKEINGYVEEKYGFKLHSAFIAQVKREMGIEMGEKRMEKEKNKPYCRKDNGYL